MNNNTSLKISNTDEGDDREEAAAALSVSASAEDDTKAWQLSFTERITGLLLWKKLFLL